MRLGASTTRNSFCACPQAALLLKPLLKRAVPDLNNRFIDWVPAPADGPQELDIALHRLTAEQPPTANALGEALLDSLRRWIDWQATPKFKEALRDVIGWAWRYEGKSSARFVTKAPSYTVRVDLLLEQWPNARFVYIERERESHVRSLARVIHTFNDHFGLVPVCHDCMEDAERSRELILDQWAKQKQLIPEGRLVEVRYEDLVENPAWTVAQATSVTARNSAEMHRVAACWTGCVFHRP